MRSCWWRSRGCTAESSPEANSVGLPGVPGVGRRGWDVGTRCKSRSAARPSRWRLCVQIAYEAVPREQCAFTHVSPLPSMATHGPATPPTPPLRQLAGAQVNIKIRLRRIGYLLRLLDIQARYCSGRADPWSAALDPAPRCCPFPPPRQNCPGRGMPAHAGTVGRHGWRPSSSQGWVYGASRHGLAALDPHGTVTRGKRSHRLSDTPHPPAPCRGTPGTTTPYSPGSPAAGSPARPD